MLLIGWIMDSDWYQDEEDEQRPDNLNQKLELKHNGWWQSLIKGKKGALQSFDFKYIKNKLIIPKQWLLSFSL